MNNILLIVVILTFLIENLLLVGIMYYDSERFDLKNDLPLLTNPVVSVIVSVSIAVVVLTIVLTYVL